MAETTISDRFSALGIGGSSAAVQSRDVPDQALMFCPILALAKLPYKYVPKRYSESVAKSFFAGGRFWERGWELSYIWSEHPGLSKPVAFVLLKQAQTLIQEINDAHPTFSIELPDDAEEMGLVIDFDDISQFRPRHLGTCKSKIEYDELIAKAPKHQNDVGAGEEVFAMFQDKLDLAIDAGKTKGKAYKAKKQESRLAKQATNLKQFERAQQYLGLLPATSDQTSSANTVAPLDLSAPPPFPCAQDVIFIAVDLEAWEYSQGQITEIGISTLDTRDLHNVAPGDLKASSWASLIRARHFKIRERLHLVNRTFVAGYPDNFQFGTSEVVSLADAPAVVASCFRAPYSARESSKSSAAKEEKRNIILLGHDTSADLSYLRTLGYDPLNLGNLLEVMDTSAMHKGAHGNMNGIGLGGLCSELGIEPWFMHNAGNDAAYTLQALLAMGVKARAGTEGDEGAAKATED